MGMYFFSEVQWNSKGMSFRISRPELVNRLCHLIVVWPWASHFVFSALFPSSISDGMCGQRFWWQIEKLSLSVIRKHQQRTRESFSKPRRQHHLPQSPSKSVHHYFQHDADSSWSSALALVIGFVVSLRTWRKLPSQPSSIFKMDFTCPQFLGAASPIPLWSWFNRLAEPGNHWDTWKWVFGIFIFLSGRWALPQMVGARSKWREELQVLGGHKEKDNHSLKVLVTQSCLTLCDPMHQILVSMEFSRQEYWSG